MAGLLVSVRSADEARAALAGGAAVIDVKEPDRGPLGRADARIWRDVRRVVPPTVPVSVALGELSDWADRNSPAPSSFVGITYRKLGLTGSGADWARRWAHLRTEWGNGPAWVAVAYADAERAGAPHADEVLDEAIAAGCAGVLVDTWSKDRPCPLDRSWAGWVRRAQSSGLLVALAGRLDRDAIVRLGPLRPDLFAVRGAACAGGNRRGTIDPDRVAKLAQAARGAALPAIEASRGLSRSVS